MPISTTLLSFKWKLVLVIIKLFNFYCIDLPAHCCPIVFLKIV